MIKIFHPNTLFHKLFSAVMVKHWGLFILYVMSFVLPIRCDRVSSILIRQRNPVEKHRKPNKFGRKYAIICVVITVFGLLTAQRRYALGNFQSVIIKLMLRSPTGPALPKIEKERMRGCMRYHLLLWASCQIRKIAGCACAGNAGNVFPAPADKRSPHASRHVRDARAVMHAGIAH